MGKVRHELVLTQGCREGLGRDGLASANPGGPWVCAALEAGLGAHSAPSDLPALSLLPHLSQGMAIFAVVGGSQRLP